MRKPHRGSAAFYANFKQLLSVKTVFSIAVFPFCVRIQFELPALTSLP